MVRRFLYALSIAGAACALAGAVSAADQDSDAKPPPMPKSFYQKFLAPRMASKLDGEVAAATAFVDTASNPWTRDVHTVGRIEHGAISAATGALKQYVLQQLQVDNWSVTVFGGRASGLGTGPAGPAATRVRFGISHMTPRADVLIPSAHGNVIFSADARGGLSTSFDSRASNFSLGVSFDPPSRSGTFSLTRRF